MINNRVAEMIKSRVSLAPMAGITDYVLRRLVREYSPTCLLTTEMISSESVAHVKESCIVKKTPEDSPVSFQLSGHKPELIASAASFLEERSDMIDINMGCPVRKVVCGQDGSALMRNPELAADIVCAVKESIKKPVSVKFRLGYTFDEMNYVEFGQRMQAAGADFVTIHARTRSQMYTGQADWAKIRDLKNNVDVPVFANGDVVSVETAEQCLELSGADGVAVGRGILGDVSLIHRIEHYLATGEKLKKPSFEENVRTFIKHLDGEIALRGEEVGIRFVRKFYPYYITGVANAAKYRGELVRQEDYKTIIATLNQIVLHNAAVLL